MSITSSNITLHMVASLDGFIAKKDGDISWMESKDQYEQGVSLSKEDIAGYLDAIDCYVMGSNTYEHALELGWPYGNTPVKVLTHRDLHAERETVEFLSGNLEKLVNEYLKPSFQHIWLVGGAMLAKEFLQRKLVNDIVLSVMPIILGDGVLFFDYIGIEQPLHLKDVKAYQDGMVELCYEVK
ncbi:MAG: dihydrofolate reductase family protein [Bacteroidota bacterium]